MINLTFTPQRADIKAEYSINNDVLTVKIDGITENFDFTGLPEGRAEKITVASLPVNPIVSVKKIGTTVNITVIHFYGADEKPIYEVT